MLSRSGYVIPKSQDFKDNHRSVLTVRPQVNGDYGARPPSFRVYKSFKNHVAIPRYYGQEHIGTRDLTDKRPEPQRCEFNFTGKLRDATRQNEAFSKAVSALNTTGGGILTLPCGYGKTTVALAIAAHMKVRTMVIVHKEFLANQWRDRIKQFCPGATIGIVQQNKVNVDCDIVIAMLQSLAMKDYEDNIFESVGMVIVDEAHHICAKVFSQALFKFCPKYTLGLTATPDRKDGLTDILFWFMGPSILAIEREVRGNTIVNTTVFECDHYNSPPPVTRFGKVSLVQMITDLVELEERNDMIENLAREHVAGNSRRLLILSGRRDHCTELAERLKDLGTGLYMGGMKEKALAESAEQKIIVGTFSQAHEGLDIPVLDTIILATPKSDVKQAVGRILRETEGKTNDALVLDIRDKWGLLSSMYYKRRALYKKSGFNFDACSGADDDPPASKKKLLTGFSFL